MYSPEEVAFTIYLILAFLVGLAGVFGYFHSLSKLKEFRAQMEENVARDQQADVAVAGASVPPVPEGSRAQDLRFVESRIYSNHLGLNIGTVLYRYVSSIGRGLWFGGSEPIFDSTVDLMLHQGSAIELPDTTTLQEASDQINFSIAEISASTRASARETMQGLADIMAGLNQTYSRHTAMWTTATLKYGKIEMSESEARLLATVAEELPRTPAKPVGPKSAYERLLEDDLIPDDDAGVKPGS